MRALFRFPLLPFGPAGACRMLCLLLLCLVLPLPAQEAPPAPEPAASTNEWTAVRVGGRRIFDVIGIPGGLSSTQRAARINRRLENLIGRDESVRPFNEQDLVEQGGETTITLGGERILSVTEADATESLMTRKEVALMWGSKLATAIAEARDARANPLRGVGILIRNSFRDLIVATVEWLPRLAGAIVLWIFFWLLARLVRGMVRISTERMNVEGNLRQLLRAIGFYGTWVLGIVAILSTLGLESGGIATALGISGFVIGFAFKDILSHFFAGLMILFGRQFRIGDQIVMDQFEGTVERIELRAMHLRNYDNRLVIIPNGDVFTSAIISNTASPYRRREFVVGIGYEANINMAKRIALTAMQDTEGVREDPPPDVLVDELAASTVNLRMRFYMNSARSDFLRVGSDCMQRVKEAFDREGISMPTDITTIFIENLKDAAGILKDGMAAAEDGSETHGSGKRPVAENLDSRTDANSDLP